MELKSPEKEVEYKASVGEDGRVVLKKKSKIKLGKKSKAAGTSFELRVRKDLEEKGWVVDKWSNNVELRSTGSGQRVAGGGRIAPCKRVFRPFGQGRGVMTIGTGFPDFVALEKRGELYKVIGVEVKMNGKLSREEKLKCVWLLKNKVFSEILVASKVKEKNRIRVVYVDFLEIEKGMRASD